MLDFGTWDYGTYYDIIIPEPDSPLTLDWGSRMAGNTAKITKAFIVSGTAPAGSVGTYEIIATRANFSDYPITKIYTCYDGITWTDFQFVGTGNNLFPTSNALVTFTTIDQITTGTSRMLFGTGIGLGWPVSPWILLQYGR